MKTILTWQNFAGNSGTATTTWNYDAARGFLASKQYSDSSTVSYSNSAAGKLLARIWARGTTTSYAYNTAGDLGAISYSDSTPAVAATYDRRGRKTTITSGSNAYTNTYNDAGQVLSESFPDSGMTTTNGYDSLLRRTALTGSSVSIFYSYDHASRPSTFSFGSLIPVSYTYAPNSCLVSNIVFKNTGLTKLTVTKKYDNLNRLTSVTSTPSGSPAISFSYTYNSANQRTQAVLADGSYWLYQYDSLGQVTSGQKYWSDGSAVAGEQFGYQFDNIGNRQSITANSNVGTYTANSLNQYTQRSVPPFTWELGNAASNATVTINRLPTTRKGQYFAGELGVANSSSALYTQLVTLGVVQSGTNLMSSTTGHVFVAKSPEIFGYDADGNLTNDGRWSYIWDGENRLVQMQTLTNLPTAVPQEKLLFGYDYQGRRTSKVVSNFNGSTWSAATNLKFAYDGWDLLAEVGTGGTIVRSYLWGLDLSGSMQGAGGVGGLLAIGTTNGQYFVAYDGNGNVMALVNTSSGSVSAQYEYGPFGETLRATDSTVSLTPFRFSTKYTDTETGILYYGIRSYSPMTGRWLCRDPFQEAGGQNLYEFASNDTLDKTDYLGGWANGTGYAGHVRDAVEWNLIKIYASAIGYNLTWTAMSHADVTLGGDWTLNDAEIAKIKGTETYLAYLSKLKDELRIAFASRTGIHDWISPEDNLNFRDYDGKGDEYNAFGDVRFGSKGSVCANQTSIGYAATIHLQDVYTFLGHNYDSLAFYTPTALGYRLESHGWIVKFSDYGEWYETVETEK